MNADAARTEQLASHMTSALDTLTDAVATALAEARKLHGYLGHLAGRTCNGSEYWRDMETSPKLYIIHATGTPCPLHGTPEPGKRIRAYIGTKPREHRRARAAMHGEVLRRRYEARIAEIESALAACYQLDVIARKLRRRD